MSKLSLCASSNLAQINQEGQAQFYIQNILSVAQQSDESPIIFKIKANIIENIGVKPTYGILMSKGNQSKRKITVKYTGKQQQISKIKLHIRWMSLPRDLEALNQDGKKVIYSQIYKQCLTKEEEKYQQIVFKYQQNKQIASQGIYESQQFRFKSHVGLKQQEKFLQMKKKISENSGQSKKQKVQILSLKKVFLLVFFTFLLGISFGVRIHRIQIQQPEIIKQVDNPAKNNSFTQQ